MGRDTDSTKNISHCGTRSLLAAEMDIFPATIRNRTWPCQLPWDGSELVEMVRRSDESPDSWEYFELRFKLLIDSALFVGSQQRVCHANHILGQHHVAFGIFLPTPCVIVRKLECQCLYDVLQRKVFCYSSVPNLVDAKIIARLSPACQPQIPQ